EGDRPVAVVDDASVAALPLDLVVGVDALGCEVAADADARLLGSESHGDPPGRWDDGWGELRPGPPTTRTCGGPAVEPQDVGGNYSRVTTSSRSRGAPSPRIPRTRQRRAAPDPSGPAPGGGRTPPTAHPLGPKRSGHWPRADSQAGHAAVQPDAASPRSRSAHHRHGSDNHHSARPRRGTVHGPNLRGRGCGPLGEEPVNCGWISRGRPSPRAWPTPPAAGAAP